MKSIRQYAPAALGLGIVVTVLALTDTRSAIAQTFKPLLAVIVNDAANPVPTRDTDNPARHPFQIRLCTPGVGCTDQSFTVAGDKRLVIEYVSGSCSTGTTGVANLLLVGTTVGGTHLEHGIRIELVRVGTTSTSWNVAQLTRIYADPGSSVELFSSGSGSVNCVAILSGYHVNS